MRDFAARAWWRQPAKSGTSSTEIRRNKAGIQGGKQAEWPRLVRALADR